MTVLLETCARARRGATRWKLDRRLTWRTSAPRAELDALGMCTTGFATSMRPTLTGSALPLPQRVRHGPLPLHRRPRLRWSTPKLVTYSQSVETCWRNTYNHTNHLTVTLDGALFERSALSKPPKTYRVEYADGRRRAGIYVPAELARAPPPARAGRTGAGAALGQEQPQ